MLRRCLGCGKLTTKARCKDCTSTLRAKYHGTWPAHSQQVIADYVARFGYVCNGWRVPKHPSTDLTLDHRVGVLCRACNTRKKNLGDS